MENPTAAPQAPEGAGTVQESKDAAASVASTTAQEAKRVAGDAKDQVRHLIGETRGDLQEQAAGQQTKLASRLRDLADELRQMADGTDESGMARGLVDDVARRAGSAASWLDDRDPGSLLEEARSFARRRPGAFLAIAAGAGVVAGRLSRGLVDEARETDSEEPGWESRGGASAQRGYWDGDGATGPGGSTPRSSTLGQVGTAGSPAGTGIAGSPAGTGIAGSPAGTGIAGSPAGTGMAGGAAMTSGAVAGGGTAGTAGGLDDSAVEELLTEDDDVITRAER